MYTLVAFLSLLATATFLHAFAFRRRRYALFALVLALLLYTHYWAIFLALGGLVALVALAGTAPPGSARPGARRRARVRLRGAGLRFLGADARRLDHTGAPWSSPPPAAALLAVAGLALAAALAPPGSGGRDAHGRALRRSRSSPPGRSGGRLGERRARAGWAGRYLAILVGPLLLLGGAALARVGPSERSPRRRSAARGR